MEFPDAVEAVVGVAVVAPEISGRIALPAEAGGYLAAGLRQQGGSGGGHRLRRRGKGAEAKPDGGGGCEGSHHVHDRFLHHRMNTPPPGLFVPWICEWQFRHECPIIWNLVVRVVTPLTIALLPWRLWPLYGWPGWNVPSWQFWQRYGGRSTSNRGWVEPCGVW